MQEMEAIAESLGLGVLVEVHDGDELERRCNCARRSSASTTATCAPSRSACRPPSTCCRASRGRIVVTESGILAPADVALMRANQVNAFLVGEAFMRVEDPGAGLASLFG
jgi:indole-3-glycerol phosphate synthase